ncbi:DUF6348 family protein [Prosthecobacter sp.]|uniref:DUF6348 family protein n=1 Tax=Prosthecobacter sp. TaxID=1965333 RepID=UPI00378505DB
MFEWLRSTPAPIICPDNPGNGTSIQCAFSNATGTWNEEVDLLQSLADVMLAAGHSVQIKKGWLEVDDGFVILPQFYNLQPQEPSGVSTCSTIEVRHSNQIPQGVFEYQHSFGENLAASFARGFQKWLEIDFAVFQDTVLKKPENCLSLEMSFPAKDGSPPHYRRALLGPVSLTRAEPPAAPVSEDEHEAFCPCCLFMSLSEPLKPHMESSSFMAIRFFAARSADGEASADCRINGMDWEPGRQALLEYVGKWPGQGFECRKQYGVLHSVDGPFETVAQDEQPAD